MDGIRPRTQVDMALCNTAAMLEPFLTRAYAAWKGNDDDPWTYYLMDIDNERRWVPPEEPYLVGDLSRQLRMLIILCRQRTTPFDRLGLRAALEAAEGVRDVRNAYAHHHTITPAIADRAVEQCNQLLRWIGAPRVAGEASEHQLANAVKEYVSYLDILWDPRLSSETPIAPVPTSPELEIKKLMNRCSDLVDVDYELAEGRGDFDDL